LSCMQTRGTFVLEINRLLDDISNLSRVAAQERVEYIDTLVETLYCDMDLKGKMHDLLSQAIAVVQSLNTLRGAFAPPPINIFAAQMPISISPSVPMYYSETSAIYRQMPEPPQQKDVRIVQVKQILSRVKQIALTIDCGS